MLQPILILILIVGSLNGLLPGASNLGGYASHFRPATVSGQITDSKGNPAGGAVVSTLDGHSTTADAAGHYTLHLEASGTYTIRGEGAAGSAAQRVEVTQGETATLNLVLRTDLYFPFYQAQGSFFTGFAVSNFSAENAVMQFTAYGPDGQPLPFPVNPALFELAGQNQLGRLGSEIFGVEAGAAQGGWIHLISDNPGVGSFFLAGTDAQLDGSAAVTRQAQRLYFTRVFEGAGTFRRQRAATLVGIANPNDYPITLRLRLGGTQAADRLETVPARGFFLKSVSELFILEAPLSGAYIRADVTDGDGAVGFLLIQLPESNTLIGLNALADSSAGEFFSAQLANGNVAPGVGFFTDLKLINGGLQLRELVIEAIGEDGNPLAAAARVQLPARGLLERDVGELLNLGPSTALPNRVGSIRVRADGPGVLGDVVFGESNAQSFAAALPLQSRRFLRAIFSHVANAPGLFTGLALYNPGDTAADLVIEVYSAVGARTGSATIRLEAGRRISRVLTDLIPSSAGQLGGYILVRSSRTIVAQQLFADFGLTFLSAVPPTIVE